ncbi:MAG: nucleoside hydrolase [Candidatus Solibacter usitatus]|nr:nucleoside hydrolase [Candidatus Solibacter usitatus]
MRPALLLLLCPALCLAAETILFDTDSGFFGDDGASLVMLLRRPDKVRIAGITVVSGNVWARQGAEYMFHILRLLDRPDVPLYLGAQAPLVHTAAMSRQEGKLEFAGAFADPPDRVQPPHGGRFSGLKPQSQPAVDFLIEAIERNPGQITFLALGPMTNLAIALRLRPDLETKILRLVFMGGQIRAAGNASRAAEFNFWFDPEAAQAVLRSRIPEKVMFGLDICNQALLTRRHYDELVSVPTPLTDLIREDMGVRYPGFLTKPKAILPMWDSLAAAWFLDPEFVTSERSLRLDVVTRFGPRYGSVIALDSKLAPQATPVRVMLTLDFPRVFRLYKELLALR